MKHVFALLSFALMSSSSAQSVGSFPTDGLALHLPFNEDVTDSGPYALQIDQFGDIEFDEGVDGTTGSCARFGEGDWLEFMLEELTAISLSAFCQPSGRGLMSDICGVRTTKHNVVDDSFNGQTCRE